LKWWTASEAQTSTGIISATGGAHFADAYPRQIDVLTHISPFWRTYSSNDMSAAKHLATGHDRSFAALSMTWGDGSHGQGLFFTIEPCLMFKIGHVRDQSAPTDDLIHWLKSAMG